MFNPDEVFPIFMGVWVILGIVSVFLFFVSKDVKFKRKVYPPFVIGTGVLFAGFIYLMGFSAEVFVVAGPAIVLITILNLRSVKFCDKCGKTLMNQNPFSTPKFCSTCGASLNT